MGQKILSDEEAGYNVKFLQYNATNEFRFQAVDDSYFIGNQSIGLPYTIWVVVSVEYEFYLNQYYLKPKNYSVGAVSANKLPFCTS